MKKITKRILWSLFFGFLAMRLIGIYQDPLGFLGTSLIFFGIFSLIKFPKEKKKETKDNKIKHIDEIKEWDKKHKK